MAASTSAAASTSTAADSNHSTCYDVFISHRGPDVKMTLASHLYRRLISYGLRVFLDYKELQEGEEFPREIESAISAASLHVAIFSPKYADSQWCLEELVLMLESGTKIIPVFHGVKPTELRRTDGEGVYATSLRNLEKKKRKSDSQPRYDSETIENWRNALSRVADKTGLDLEKFNGDEGELVDKIVEVVFRKGVKTPLNVARYPTGLAEKIQDFETKVFFQQRRCWNINSNRCAGNSDGSKPPLQCNKPRTANHPAATRIRPPETYRASSPARELSDKELRCNWALTAVQALMLA